MTLLNCLEIGGGTLANDVCIKHCIGVPIGICDYQHPAVFLYRNS